MIKVRLVILCVCLGSLCGWSSAYAADLPSTAAPPAAAPPPFFVFSDTVLEYRLESQATEPGLSTNFPKQIANVTHVDAFKYGTNFVSVDVLQSTNADPTSGNAYFTGDGSREVYFIYRGTLSGNAVTHSKTFAFGNIVKDVSLEYGTDLESHNNNFGARKTAVVVGPNIAFDVPGLFNVGLHFYKEWNRNAFVIGGAGNADTTSAGEVSFHPTAEFEVVYLQPLAFTGLPLSFNGFANVVLPKGIDGFGNPTKTEFLTTNRLTLDVSHYIGLKTHVVDVFVGHKFWYNKFGNTVDFRSPYYTAGSYENQFICGLDVHLQ